MTGQSKRLSALLCIVILGLSACAPYYGYEDEDAATPAAPPITRPAVQTYAFGTDTGHPVLRNQDGSLGAVRDTRLIVMSGDRVEIKPTGLIREERKVLVPTVTRENHNVCLREGPVCVARVPIFQRRCEERCNICIKCPLFVGCFPWRCCNTVCQDVRVGDQCVSYQNQCIQTENQWKETSMFAGLAEPSLTRDASPMSSQALMASGLKLRFFTGQRQVDCPVNQFKPEVDAEKFTLHLRNVDGCQPFADAQARAFLSMVNAMGTPISYQQGRLVKTWDGRSLEQPRTMTHLPVIDFSGSVSVFAPSAD